MAATSFFALIAIVSFTHLSVFSFIEATHGGFSVDIIHRDSPLSPLYNSKATPFERLQNAFRRSISRVNHFKPTSLSSKEVQTDIVPSGGEYFMDISIGTPPVKVRGIADTGSDLTWTQCKPCKQCFEQKLPLYDPKESSSYTNVGCESNACNALDGSERSCGQDQNTCLYSYSYGDHSFTRGNVAVEKFTVGSTTGRPVSLPKIVFGCGHDNGGTFDDVGSGIIGLGGGSLSMISQLSTSINGKFSYCLIPGAVESNGKSKINFGSNAVVSGSNVVTTPLVDKEPSTYYYLTLEAISVGNKRLAYNGLEDGNDIEEGNIIIDSGTTLTFLGSDFYEKLVSILEEAIDAERVSDPSGLLSVCFKAGNEIDLPIITVHFTGADVKLKPFNTFAKVEEDLMCFTMTPSNDVSIFGNLSQMDFLVGYDLVKNTVSFMRTDCTKH